MKKGKKIVLLLSAAILLATSMPVELYVEAGNRATTLDTATLTDGAVWNNLAGDVTVEKDTLIFPKESTKSTRFISKTSTQANSELKVFAKLNCGITFNQLPKDQKFALAFGLTGIESGMEEAGNVEVVFSNDNGVKVEVVAYEKAQTPNIICKLQSCGISMNQKANLEISLGDKQGIVVKVNNREICSASLPVSGKGRMGFLQTGECAAKVSGLDLKFYEYDRPENSNFYEDFERGGLDVAVLTSANTRGTNYYPHRTQVQKYKDGHVLMFENVGEGYLGTLYTYSNFELSFDVPFIQTADLCDENGVISKPKNAGFGISFGGAKSDYTGIYGYMEAQDMVTFNNDRVYSFRQSAEHNEGSLDYPFISKFKPFSVKLSVVDGEVTASLKWVEEEEFTTILNYKMDEGSVEGYVHFWITQTGNMAIDNIKMTNLDTNPNTIEVEYQDGAIEIPPDFGYQPFEIVYAEEEKEDGLSWYWLIPATLVIGALIPGVTILTTRHKKGKKEAVKNEE